MELGTFSRWVARISGVRPEEGRRTLLSALFYFFFVAHVVMIKSAANALFLSRHDPKDLRILYILVAVAVAVVVVFTARTLINPRRRLTRLFSLGFVAAALVIFWALLRFELLPVSPALYLFGEITATVLNIQFWSVAGDIFDPQEGKRVFGILAGGGMSGSIFGGLFVHHASPLLGTVNLLLTGAGALLICVACATWLARHSGKTAAPGKHAPPSLRMSFRYVMTESYPRTLGLLMMLGSVLTVFVDYFFRTSARAFLFEDELAALFGDLNFYVGVVSVGFLFLLSSRILRRFGIFNYLLFVPAGMVLACVVSVFVPAFGVVYALKIVENSGSLSVNQAGLQLLYNPMPTSLRTPARSVIDGFFRKMGYAVGGVALLVFASALDRPAYEIITIAMVLVFVSLLFVLRSGYIRSLDDRIRVGPRGPVQLRLEDASTRLALLQRLDSPDSELAHTSLLLLDDIPSVDLKVPLKKLIGSDSERLRLTAIEAVARRGYKEFLFELLELVNSGTRRTRAAAIRAIMTLDPERAVGTLAPYLRADDPGLVAAAIETMIRSQGFSPSNPAIPILEELLRAGSQAPPPVRRETARLLGRLTEGPYAECLSTYLADPDPSVRRLAAQSARQVYRPDFVPHILRLLSDRETRREARNALAAYGDRVIEVLESWLNDRDRPIEVRIRLPRVLRMIGTQRAGEVLLFSNIQDDALLRYRIALALSGIRLHHPEIHFDRKWAVAAVDRRLDSYRYYADLHARLARVLPPGLLVMRLLQDRLVQNIEVAFRVLGLIYPHRTIMSIHQRIKDAPGGTWSDAMELLDNLIDRELRDRFFPILENHPKMLTVPPPTPGDPVPPEYQEILGELSESRDSLLQAAAIHTRCQLGENCSHLYPALVKGVSTVNIMEKVLFLESVEIFKQNNLDDLTALAAIAQEKAFKSGESILTEGEPGDALFIVTQGTVEIVKKNRKLLTVGEKGSLGGVSLLDQKPHAASAIAITDCRTLLIDRTDFMDLVSDRVELLHGIFLALTDRLRALLAVTEEGELTDRHAASVPNPV